MSNLNSIANLRPFKQGPDPRRNRKGRPKSFDALRKLAQKIAIEPIAENITRVELILKTMAEDKRLMQAFLEYAYGKVPAPIDVTLPEGITFIIQRTDGEKDDKPVPEAG